MKVKNSLVVFLLIAFSIFAQDDDMAIVAVGKASLKSMKIGFLWKADGVLTSELKNQAIKFTNVLKNDFLFYKKEFVVKDTREFTSKNNTMYRRKAYDYVGYIKFKRKKNLNYSIEIYNLNNDDMIFSSKGVIKKDKLRKMAHNLSDRIFRQITNRPSIFNSYIVFVSDRNSKFNKIIKELYIMDFDGGNKRQLTFHGGTVISPAISIDGKKVLYSLIRSQNKKKRNIDLWIMDLKSKKSKKISSRRGINSGAVFMPDGNNILLTLSHQGNAELYMMNLSSKKIHRLTKHYAPDVDPSVDITGENLTFLSGRAGKPMIYTASTSAMEKDVKRISFVGDFNATPRFSPDGKDIVFSSWINSRFDIFRISASGQNLSRLTKNFGSNEGPTYSNDGKFIAFSSQRVISRNKATHDIYVMDTDGEIISKVTSSFGKCISPRWSR